MRRAICSAIFIAAALLGAAWAQSACAQDTRTQARAAVIVALGSPEGLRFRNEKDMAPIAGHAVVCGEVTSSNALGRLTGGYERFVWSGAGTALEGQTGPVFEAVWERSCKAPR